MIVCRWRNVADIVPGDLIASLQPRRAVEHSRVLVGLARKLEAGQRPGRVVLTLPTSVDTIVDMRVGSTPWSQTYANGAELAVVSVDETDLDNLTRMGHDGTPTPTATGQEA